MKLLPKAGVAIVVAGVTWLFLTPLRAQIVKYRAGQQVARGTQAASGVLTEMTPGRATANRRVVLKNATDAVASTSIHDMQISTLQGSAMINAIARMTDSRPGIIYVWRLRNISLDNKVVWKTLYADQLFTMEADGQMEPTFQEVIEVPAGESKIELTLYALPKGTNLGVLDDEEAARSYMAAMACKPAFN